jgi:Na+-translocating ferredoxin:NAD+ oxidoreductase RNF subunit RnfB
MLYNLVLLELNVDLSVVDRMLRMEGKCSPLGGALINQIQRLLNLEWEVVVKHTYCEANKYTKMLANIGCNIDIMDYEVCPSEQRVASATPKK